MVIGASIFGAGAGFSFLGLGVGFGFGVGAGFDETGRSRRFSGTALSRKSVPDFLFLEFLSSKSTGAAPSFVTE
jgi:hypothetical protein